MNNGWNAPQSSGPMSWPAAPVKPALIIPPEIKLELAKAGEPENKDGLLMLHKSISVELTRLKALEMEVRKLTVDALLGDDKKEGMNTVELGGGYQAKAKVTWNYKLVSDREGVDAIDAIDDCIDDFAKIDSNEGSFIADRLFNWQAPALSLTEYRKLEEEAKSSPVKAALLKRLQRNLNISEGAPTLEIKEPKTKAR